MVALPSPEGTATVPWICTDAWSVLQVPPFSAASLLYMTLLVLEMWHLQKQKSKTKKTLIPSLPNMLIYAKYNEILPLSTFWHLDLKGGGATRAAPASTAFRRSSKVWVDFWSCIKHYLVIRMVEGVFWISIFVYRHFVVGSFEKTHLFLCLFLLIDPKQLSVWCT